jgi:hypothetical protein
MSAISAESIMIVPLWFLIAGIISQLSFRLFTYFQNSGQKLPSFCSTDHNNVSCAVLYSFTALGYLKGTPQITRGFLNTSYMLVLMCLLNKNHASSKKQYSLQYFIFDQE